MSTSAIASLVSSNDGFASQISSTTKQLAINKASDTVSTSASSSSPTDALTHDIVQLLKALVSGDVPGASKDLAKFKADLNAQSNAQATSNLAKDADSLLKDVSSGNASGEKADVSKIQQDLQTQAASGARVVPASIQTISPLDALAGKLTTSLTTGSTSTALKDLASYLVQNGQGTGTLVNTTA